MNKVLGIIAAEGDNVNVKGVMNYRPVHTIYFLGRYKFVDFPISNLTNSGVDKIHVYLKKKPRTVFEHIGTGRHYNISSKRGRIRIMYGEKEVSSSVYNTDVQSYLQNLEYIQAEDAEHVVILAPHITYTQDIADVVEKHKKSNADVTVLYKDIDDANKSFIGCDSLRMIKGQRIVEMETNRGRIEETSVSLESYVMKKSLFIRLINEANEISPIYWFKDIIADNINMLDIRGYDVKSRAIATTDLKSYYQNSMNMLKISYNDLFKKDWEIHTKTSDSSPTIYGHHADVSNSLIANGSIIDGKVTNCIIGRDVTIEKGADLENCIIMAHSHIGEDKKLQGVVLDKNVKVEKIDELIAKDDDIIYVKKNDQI